MQLLAPLLRCADRFDDRFAARRGDPDGWERARAAGPVATGWAAAKLVADGAVYFCDCTSESVQARNKEAGGKPGYDGFCRDRGLEPGPGRAARFRTPRAGRTAWTDLVRGEVSFANADLEDFVVALRSAWGEYARTVGNVRYYTDPGCSIDPNPAVFQQLKDFDQSHPDLTTPEAMRARAEAWKAIGSQPQKVRVLGVPFDCRFAGD